MNLTDYIYKDADQFYLDIENYSENVTEKLILDYEDGDRIIWTWENKKYSGVLRDLGSNDGLFLIDKVTPIE
jgi:hypothetical protein